MDALILATNRPNYLKQWHEAWEQTIKDKHLCLFIMHDSWEGFEVPLKYLSGSFCHSDVLRELKQDAWIIPQQTSACKSYAIYKAWKAGAKRIFCLDDDCFPSVLNDWYLYHKANLSDLVLNHVYLTIEGTKPRGVPYLDKEPIMLSHGLWDNIPDIDAVTQLGGYDCHDRIHRDGYIPKGALFPFSGMNWACNREIIPLMYFGLQGKAWGVDRYDDIWCGFIAKKIMDHLNYAVWSGEPSIDHTRLSDPFANLEKEAKGYKWNCNLYQFLMNGFQVRGNTILDCLVSVGKQLGSCEPTDYFKKYGEALQIWASLFREA